MPKPWESFAFAFRYFLHNLSQSHSISLFLDIKFLLVPLLNFKSSGKVQKSEVWGSGKHKLLSHYIVVLSHMGHGTKICKFHLISFFHFNYIERNLSEEMWDLRTISLQNFSSRKNDKFVFLLNNSSPYSFLSERLIIDNIM